MEGPLRNRPIGFAHRGAPGLLGRENTLSAFRRALAIGASGLESDARLTADGSVVLVHGERLGPPWRRLSVASADRQRLPHRVPTLEDLYRDVGSGFHLSLDLKDPRALRAVLEIAAHAGEPARLWLCRPDWLDDAEGTQEAAAAGVRIVCSTALARLGGDVSAQARQMAAWGIGALNLHSSEWTGQLIRRVHDAGLLVLAWGTRTRRAISLLAGIGVDGIYCDSARALADLTAHAPPGGGSEKA